jgi:hypothetical protein
MQKILDSTADDTFNTSWSIYERFLDKIIWRIEAHYDVKNIINAKSF